MGSTVGVLYGTASSTRFDLAVTDADLRRLDYVTVHHEGHEVLCQVEDVLRKGGVSFEDALAGAGADDRLAAQVQVVGYLEAGRVQTPRTPFANGQEARRAPESLVTAVLGLEPEDGAFLGHVKGSSTPVRLSMNMLAQKHVSVLAKTGAGKSYTVGVLLEEFLSAGVPLVILDPHGEYGALRHANLDPGDAQVMAELGLRPRSFDKQVHEYALDTHLNPDSQPLRLEGINLEGREIVDLLGGKLSGGQVGLLYQAVKEVKEHLPGYTLQDIMDVVALNKSAAKWNVINALEALEGTGVFHIRGTAAANLVRPRECTIINLKGVAPDVQEVAVARLVGLLWEARKRGDVPPFILVCEEAHNFCPERGVGNAVSGAIIRTVASEGRKFGMGLVIVSQRPAKIDKNVLSQCNTQFVLKVTNPNDLKAIVSSVEGITAKASDEVQRLAIGTALVAGGGLTQPVFVEVRPRLTQHGGHSVDVVQTKGSPVREAHASKARETPIQHSGRTAETARSPMTPTPREPWAASILDEGVAGKGARGRGAPESDPPAPVAAALASGAASADAPGGGAAKDRPRGPGPSDGDHPGLSTPGPARDGPTVTSSAPGRNNAQRGESSRILETVVQNAPSSPPEARTQDPAPRSARPLDPPPRPPAVDPAPAWTAEDAPAIHRVAARVGVVTERRDPADTLHFLKHLAVQNGRNPDMRVGLYAEIARKVCHDEAPMCIRCPLASSCQHHQALRTERKKTRAGIRRLWTR